MQGTLRHVRNVDVLQAGQCSNLVRSMREIHVFGCTQVVVLMVVIAFLGSWMEWFECGCTLHVWALTERLATCDVYAHAQLAMRLGVSIVTCMGVFCRRLKARATSATTGPFKNSSQMGGKLITSSGLDFRSRTTSSGKCVRWLWFVGRHGADRRAARAGCGRGASGY